ncbi:glycosyltransferase family 39 protein [Candidatus Dojkabacteria bacterium]|nr:glycosyltransferase family 39 protein [Candidatus Dojkabacteria bacterium]
MEATNRIKIIYKLFFKNLLNISQKPLYQILGIFLLALIIRLYKLGEFPVGFHIDEVKVGWNALSILKTLRDDQGHLLPLYYNTFGDYRPTGIFYLSIPALAIFGNTIFAVRLTSSIFGALTVFPIYLISKHLFNNKENNLIAIFASLLLAVSPWHIETSRATSEVVISGFFVTFAIYFALKNKNMLLSIISIVASYTLYHSARILLPLYLILNKKLMVFAIILTLILSLGSSSRARLSQVSIFNSENVKYELLQSGEHKVVVYTRTLIKEYGKYFSTDFLIGESAKPYRYLTLGVGLLNYIDFILLIIGLFLLVKNKEYLIPLFLFISPIASILTTEDAPNLHRSLYMVFFIVIIEGYALSYLKYYKTILTILAISLLYFLYAYFYKSDLHIPYQKNLYIDSPTFRNIGNIELATKLEQYKNEYKLIYVTNFPDNIYPWYAFINKKDPKEFNSKSIISNSNERRYENIIFTDTKCPTDFIKDTNVLVIDSGECPTETKIKDGMKAKIIEQIKRPNNTTVFNVVKL